MLRKNLLETHVRSDLNDDNIRRNFFSSWKRNKKITLIPFIKPKIVILFAIFISKILVKFSRKLLYIDPSRKSHKNEFLTKFQRYQKKLGRFFICWSKTCAKKKKILSSSLLERLDFCSLLYLKNVSDLFHKLILWRKKVLFPHEKQKKTRLKLTFH